MDTRQKVEPLTFEADRYSPELDFREVSPFAWRQYSVGEWCITIASTGIDAERRLNIHDITAIRDWCNAVLAAEARGEAE